MGARVLVLGATSSIARAAANAFAKRGDTLLLAGRDAAELGRIASDIRIRYGRACECATFDATDIGSHRRFLDSVVARLGGLDGVLLAFGLIGTSEAMHDAAHTVRVINVNFTGAASILSLCADYFEVHKDDGSDRFIIGISSVAGERGRQSNYPYGAAKGGLSLFLQGLRNRLHRSGVCVITVKLGFVDTSMTYGMPGLFLVARPDAVGEAIVKALESKADVAYLPWFWRYMMLIIRAIPERVFKRLNL